MRKTVEERFWDKVDRRGPDDCWEWTGSKSSDGYGSIGENGKTIGTHRMSYMICVSDIPKGMSVCHKCDNPPCVNPGHLFLGTHTDNIRDRERKGRGNQRMGEEHIRAKLKNADIPVIREKHSGGESIASLARSYRVSESGIRFLVKRRSWKHIP